MLKPKRKITRDEIKKDPFVESVFEVRSYIKDNSKFISRIVGGMALIILLVIFYGQSSKNNFREAEFLLTQSSLYLDNGDIENAKILLQELSDEYGGTEPGRLGGYHLAQIYLKSNNDESALPLLLDYSKKGKNPILLSSANDAVSSIYLQKNDIKSAIKYQLESVKNSKTEKDAAFSSLKLAELYIKDGSIKNSLDIMNELKNQFTNDPEVMRKIDFISGLLMDK